MRDRELQRWVAAACVLAVSLLLWLAPADAESTTYSGRAVVVDARVAGISTVLSDTGDLPPEGGALERSLLEAAVPGLLTAEVFHAATVGRGDAARSEASVARLALTVQGNTVEADFLMAMAEAICGKDQKATVRGSSEIAGLTVNGQRVTATTAPNQRINLPNGYLVINEQRTSLSNNGKTGDITVNALHVVVEGFPGADVVIASAHADITCAGNPCPGGDFATGGGWISTASDARANFAVAGGIRNGAFWGHLGYIDHATGMKVKGTSITAYSGAGTMRHIEGTAEVNGQGSFTFAVDVADNGEPGRADTFALVLSNGYKASGTLRGGNIQLHTPCLR